MHSLITHLLASTVYFVEENFIKKPLIENIRVNFQSSQRYEVRSFALPRNNIFRGFKHLNFAVIFFLCCVGIKPASATWMNQIFRGNDCPESSESNQISYSICSNSLKDFSEKNKLQLPEAETTIIEGSSNLMLSRISKNAESKEEEKSPVRHHYSKRQAWNLDETLIDLGQKIISATDYKPILDYAPISSARNWSNKDPNILIGIHFDPKPNSLVRFNVVDETLNEIHRFVGYDSCTLGKGEGNLSNDDSKIVIVCVNESKNILELIAYDLSHEKVLGIIEAEANFNWASFSQSGKYIVVENNTFPDPKPELLRYDEFLRNPLILTRNPAHGDLALDTNGDDLYVMIFDNSIKTIRLQDRFNIEIPVGGIFRDAVGSGHVSCRATDRNDWCYISTYIDQRLGAVRLAHDIPPASSEINQLDKWFNYKKAAYEHWGYHRSSSISYKAQPKATVSRSGRKILFTSDWYGETVPEEFILEISKDR